MRKGQMGISPAGYVVSQAEAVQASGAELFGPLEKAIIGALDHAQWVIGKVLASRIRERYGPRLKYTITNLIERHVLVKNPKGQGYRLYPGFRPGSPE